MSQLGKSLFQSSFSFPSDISASSTHCTAGQQHYYTLHLKYFPLSLIELGSWSSSSSSFSRPWKERGKMKTKNGWQRSLMWERGRDRRLLYGHCKGDGDVKKEGLSIVFQSNCSYLYSTLLTTFPFLDDHSPLLYFICHCNDDYDRFRHRLTWQSVSFFLTVRQQS